MNKSEVVIFIFVLYYCDPVQPLFLRIVYFIDFIDLSSLIVEGFYLAVLGQVNRDFPILSQVGVRITSSNIHRDFL